MPEDSPFDGMFPNDKESMVAFIASEPRTEKERQRQLQIQKDFGQDLNSPRRSPFVTLSHMSVKDYLGAIDPARHTTFSSHYFDLNELNHTVSHACIAYLMQ